MYHIQWPMTIKERWYKFLKKKKKEKKRERLYKHVFFVWINSTPQKKKKKEGKKVDYSGGFIF